MTGGQFLNAVALGQVTPGPVVLTVSRRRLRSRGPRRRAPRDPRRLHPVVRVHRARRARFDLVRSDPRARSFLAGAGPAAIGAILGSAIPLAGALQLDWQYGVLAGAAVVLFLLRREIVVTLLLAGATGVIVALAGGPLSH